MEYNFGWDPVKAKENIRKHRVSFEQASEIFLDPLSLTIFDEDHSIEDARWVTIGRDGRSNLLVAVHTFVERIDQDQINVRIISARKATKSEAKRYLGGKP
ncbi:MAG: BrnT family toxin [Planctomycetes bacterium]|nr:BrnT family toxin [Planctomycetota bacterium]